MNETAKKVIIILFILFLTILLLRSQKTEAGDSRTHLEIGSEALDAQVAKTPDELERGLSGVKELGENEGMVFILSKRHRHAFHMKGVLIPLSIAFLDEDGKILEIHSMDPKTADLLYPAPRKARFALEVREGWFERHHVKVGDFVKRKKGK